MRAVTLEDVARQPRPGTTAPEQLRFSPDGKTLAFLYLPPGSSGLTRVLWALDVATGARAVLFEPEGEGATDATVSREEALRRERLRQMTKGVTTYEWAAEAPIILAPILGELWIVENGSARVVGSGATDPHLSPDGTLVAFVRDGDLYVIDVATGAERRLTSDAEPGLTNGLAEYIAQEELARGRGHWWSSDGALLAYEQADERHIPSFVIPHWGTDRPEVEEHRYPFTGEQNARVRLGVVAFAGGETTWMDLGDAEYLARVDWHPDGRLFVQLLDRAQRRLELRAYDSATGNSETVLVEESPHWINLHGDLRFVGNGGEFVWSSETWGMRRLELRAPDGSLVRPLTDGTWPVDSVIAVDEETRRVAFTGSPNPLESHVWIAALDGGAPERLDARDGFTVAAVSKGLTHRVEVHQSRTSPLSVTLDGQTLHEPEAVELDLVTPELFSFPNRDGVTLYGALFRPERLPAPLIVWVYGGPHAQAVQDSWALTVDLQAQYLRAQGFAVMRVDNRGSSRRGVEFETAIAGRLGSVEIADQIDGVRFATAEGWVDGERVGMTGWSYGGYMTIMSMLKAPEIFRVGVAGAPVTDYGGYDTAYTERYMGMPLDNPDGYRDGSALTHAASLRGRLLIVHGMIDENVHFRHTVRFLEALAKTSSTCDLLLYPDERHGFRKEENRRNMHERIVRYFREHL
ncbi:MAG: DPP IV N-terminal domain-containing protein [Actinomycetota bacterium]